MEKLFRLYRYLSQCKHRENEDNSYNVALRALEQVCDLLGELDYWGQHIINEGGMQWEDADRITERIIDHHKTSLCEYAHQNAITAIIDFASTHTSTKEIDEVCKLLQEQKAKAEEAHGSYTDMPLGDLDDHPF